MKTGSKLGFWAVGLMVLATATPGRAMVPDDETGAEGFGVMVAKGWLERIDAGQYADAFDITSVVTRTTVADDDWIKATSALRARLGKLSVRKLGAAAVKQALPGLPDGLYVVVEFDSAFEHQKRSLEVVTVKQEQDGALRPVRYEVRKQSHLASRRPLAVEVQDAFEHIPRWTDLGWGWPVPLVRSGNTQLYVLEEHTAAKDQEPVVKETKVLRLDVAGCGKVAGRSFKGQVEVSAWGARPNEIWLRTAEQPDQLRTFDGATVSMPEAGPVGQIAREIGEPFQAWPTSAGGRLRVVDLEQHLVRDVPTAAGVTPHVLVQSSPPGKVFVGVSWGSDRSEMKVQTFDRAELARGPTATTVLPYGGFAPRELRLVDGGTKLARRTIERSGVLADIVDTFSLPSGERLSSFEIPDDNLVAWSASGRWLAYAIPDHPGAIVVCASELRVVDPSGKIVAKKKFDACVKPDSWVADESYLLVHHYDDKAPRLWAFDPTTGQLAELPEAVMHATPRPVQIGAALYYVEGPVGNRRLASVSLATGKIEALTGNLGDVEILAADPIARKLFLSRDRSRLSVYDVGVAALKDCRL